MLRVLGSADIGEKKNDSESEGYGNHTAGHGGELVPVRCERGDGARLRLSSCGGENYAVDDDERKKDKKRAQR